MFCQSCGAKNTDDARFCNMCGTSLARAGEAGGPIADASDTLKSDGAPVAPPAGVSHAQHSGSGHTAGFSDTSMLGVSLAGIGVRSNKKTWAVLGAIAVALVAAGALASYLARGQPVDGHAEADDPFVIGSPLPEGDGTVDAVAGTAGEEPPLGAPTPTETSDRPTRMASRTGAMRATGMRRSSGSTGSSAGSSSMSGAGSTMSGSSTAGSTMASGSTTGGSTMASGSMASGSTMTGSTGGSTTGGSTTGGSTMSGSTMAGSGSSMGPGDPLDELPPERDLSMELYSSRVRFLIRRYYGSRAQTCFDRATRNNPNVSGTVVVAMSVGADGQVTRTRVARNSTGNEALGNCLSAQVSSWRLSAPPNGPVEMQIPFSR